MKYIWAFAWVLFSGLAVAGQPFELNRGISGSWYNPDQDGHGFSMEYLDENTLLVYWYTYTPDGDSAFVLGLGSINGNQVTVPMTYTDGMVFGQFDPATLTKPDWGTVTITFNSCTSGTVAYESSFSVNGSVFGDGTFPITRLAYVQELECDVAELGRGLPISPIAGFYEGTIDTAEGAVAVIFENGKTWLLAPDGSLLIGTLNIVDSSVNGSLVVKTDDGFVAGTLSITGTFSRRDWIRGTFEGLGGGTFSLAYRSSYERDSSLSGYTGTYGITDDDGYSITINVDGSGQISGTDTDGCGFSGQISLLDPRFNPASLDLTVTGCQDIAGSYQGVVALGDFVAAGDSRLLYLAGDSETVSIAGELVKEN